MSMSAFALLLVVGAVDHNPFAKGRYYVQPSYTNQLGPSINSCQGVTECTNLKIMANTSTAFWVDSKAKVPALKAMLRTAAAQSPQQLVVIVVYDVPNRDCDSNNSVGDICCYYNPDGTCDRRRPGDCASGLADYQHNFIDPIAEALHEQEGQLSIVAIIEPDSLPNLATNLGHAECANNATGMAYTRGIPYAVRQIAKQAPSVSIYIDAAHGGWLGWEDNANAFATLVQTLQIETLVRGMATNVANYQPLGTPCPPDAFDSKMHTYCAQHAGEACCDDPCGLIAQYSAGNNEYNYVQALSRALKRALPKFEPHFLIDTSRNGVPTARADCSRWCNPEGEGAGHRPTADTALTDRVDGLFWVKPPGESDGCEPAPATCAQPPTPVACLHPDAACADGGKPCAPEAGGWYDYGAKGLAQRAAFNGVVTTAPPRGAAAPFQDCARWPCASGYMCDKAVALCVPTPETLRTFGSNGAFATRQAHVVTGGVAKGEANVVAK